MGVKERVFTKYIELYSFLGGKKKTTRSYQLYTSYYSVVCSFVVHNQKRCQKTTIVRIFEKKLMYALYRTGPEVENLWSDILQL